MGVNDSVTAVEAGGLGNATSGTNPTGNVLTNDTDVDSGDTRSVTGVSGNEGAGSLGSSTVGRYGSLTLNADGSYSYQVNNANTTVQSLRGTGNTLSDSFSYTLQDAAGLTSTATLTVTLQGANDTPLAVNDTATAVEAGGVVNGSAGSNPTGSVLSNDTDLDSGDGKTVTALAGGTVGSAKAGIYGSLTLNADGSYSYAVDNGNAAVQALRTSEDTLSETFTYTMQDSGGLTSTATLTLTIQGANDAPDALIIADQIATEANAFSFSVPAATFTDVDGDDVLSYTARLADGSELPTWLVFNVETRTFSGTPANTDGGMIEVRVSALDRAGAITGVSFRLTVNTLAPVVVVEVMPTAEVIPVPVIQPEPIPVLAPTPVAPVETFAEPVTRTGETTVEPPRAPLTSNSGFPIAVVSGSDNSGPGTLSLGRGISDQLIASVAEGIRFLVPNDAFVHNQADAVVSLTATQADGSALPPWLHFDPIKGEFVGIPPAGFSGELVVKVIARDSANNVVETTFRIRTTEQPGQAAFTGKSSLTAQFKAQGVFAWKADQDRLLRHARDAGLKARADRGIRVA